jgi:hypothetical protein
VLDWLYSCVSLETWDSNTQIAVQDIYMPHAYLQQPVARVKKIIQADDDIQSCSNNAAFVITIATELFIQNLVERTHEIIKAEKRPRRNVQYGDVGMLLNCSTNHIMQGVDTIQQTR